MNLRLYFIVIHNQKIYDSQQGGMNDEKLDVVYNTICSSCKYRGFYNNGPKSKRTAEQFKFQSLEELKGKIKNKS